MIWYLVIAFLGHFFWQIHLLQFAGAFIEPADDLLIFPVTAYDAIHDAVHADVHQLVQCRIFFHPIPPSVVLYLTSKRRISKRKNKL